MLLDNSNQHQQRGFYSRLVGLFVCQYF